MTLRFVIDMNLSPAWARHLRTLGFEALHWSEAGDPKATDKSIMEWTLQNDSIVMPNDMDFATILACTFATGPSVIQIRAVDLLAMSLVMIVADVIRRHKKELHQGVLIVIDERNERIRILPIRQE
jgi:predicted nuclease of predicted toxin-antitoxin system